MRNFLVAAIVAIWLSGYAYPENKGFCPPAPSSSAFRNGKKPSAPSAKSDSNSVTVTVLTVVSDTGYVCSAQVLNGVEKDIDKQAIQAVRTWHFEPAKKDGRGVPVIIAVEVNFTRDSEGNLVLKEPSAQASSKDASVKPQ